MYTCGHMRASAVPVVLINPAEIFLSLWEQGAVSGSIVRAVELLQHFLVFGLFAL